MSEAGATSSVAGASVRGFASLSGARAISIVLQFVTFALLAAHLGPSDFGVYTFGTAFARLFGVVTTFGFKQVVTRDAAQHPERERWLLPNFLYVRLLLGVVGYALLVAVLLVAGYPADERDAALIAGSLLVLMAVGSFSASLEIRLQLGWTAIADVVEAVALVLLVGVLVAVDAPVLAFVMAYVGVNVLNAVIVAWAALRITSYDWRPQPERWRSMTRAAMPLGLSAIFGVIYWQTDIALLARFEPQAIVGQYGAAYRILDAVNILPVLLTTVIGPVLARSVVEGAAVLQRRFGVAAHLMSLVALPLSLLGMLTAWRVLPLLPGFGEYGQGGVVLSILSPAIGAVFVAMLVQSVLISGHRQRTLLWISALGALLNVGLNLALIPAFSLYGAAAATTATEAVVLWLSFAAIRRHLGVTWPVDRLVRVASAAVALVAVAAVTYALPAPIQLVLASIAYASAALVLGAFRWEDLGGLLRRQGATVELAPGGVLATRAACRAAAVCIVDAPGGRIPWRTAVGARLGGCATVVSRSAAAHDVE